MKILAISQVYFPDTASTAQHLTDLLEALAAKGHSVSVITSKRKYEDPRILFSKKEVHKNVNIVRIKNTGFGKKNKLTRMCDFISFNLLISFKLLLLNTKEYDQIIGMTSPPLLSYIGIKIAKIKKIKFVYWTMDLQPELSIVAKYLRSDSFSAQALHKMGDYIFKHSDTIVTLDKYMNQHIMQRVNTRAEIKIIPIWPVMEKVYSEDRGNNPFRIENNFEDKIVIMYSGNHSVMHPLDTLLEAAKKLKDDPRFLFVHIGGGIRINDVRKCKEQFKLDNICLLPYQPRERIHVSLGAADLQVVIMGDNCVGYTHPNKIYGAMYIGKPILYIGPQKSHITDILNRCNGNISVQHDETEVLVEQLISFAQLSEDQRSSIGFSNKEYAEKYFHPSVLISQMVQSIEST